MGNFFQRLIYKYSMSNSTTFGERYNNVAKEYVILAVIVITQHCDNVVVTLQDSMLL